LVIDDEKVDDTSDEDDWVETYSSEYGSVIDDEEVDGTSEEDRVGVYSSE
jgi:hypothetical protein